MARTGVFVGAAVLAAGSLVLLSGEVPCEAFPAQPTCKVVMEPGPTEDTLELVHVDGANGGAREGELRLTTVAVRDDLTWRGWLSTVWSPTVDAVPRETVYPPGSDRDRVAEQNAALMADSQLVATIAGLEQLGFELVGEGAIVAAVTDDAVTDDLEVGDVIVAVAGTSVEDNRDVVEAVRARVPGARLTLDVEDATGRRRAVEVTLGSTPGEPEVPYVGVLLTTKLDLPVEVEIDAGAIGGPSAGMMFALSVVAQLSEDDLTGGRVIAGTGTVDRDGVVGGVGGVRQKVAGATVPTAGHAPASVFLVPRANLGTALEARVTSDLLLVPVATLDEAYRALQTLRAGGRPADARLLEAAT